MHLGWKSVIEGATIRTRLTVVLVVLLLLWGAVSAVMLFDPAHAPQPKDPADKRTLEEMRAAYVAAMRRIGLDRFVLASDWPAMNPPAEYFAAERLALPVTDSEWRQLCANLAPYLRPSWSRHPDRRD